MSMEVKNLFTNLVNQEGFKAVKTREKSHDSGTITDQVDIGKNNTPADQSKELSRMALTKGAKSSDEPEAKASKLGGMGKTVCLALAGITLLGGVSCVSNPDGNIAPEGPAPTEVHQELPADSLKTETQTIAQDAKADFSWGGEKITEAVKDFKESATRENHTDSKGNFTIVNQKYKKQLNDFLDRHQGKTESDSTSRGPIQSVVETAEALMDKAADKVRQEAPRVEETLKDGIDKATEKTEEAVEDLKDSFSRENYTDKDGNFTIINQKYKGQLKNFLNRLNSD